MCLEPMTAQKSTNHELMCFMTGSSRETPAVCLFLSRCPPLGEGSTSTDQCKSPESLTSALKYSVEFIALASELGR